MKEWELGRIEKKGMMLMSDSVVKNLKVAFTVTE